MVALTIAALLFLSQWAAAKSPQPQVPVASPPPARQIAQAIGVTEVKVDGDRVGCLVCGSFQPFLEALHGYEVTNLTSTPALPIGDEG